MPNRRNLGIMGAIAVGAILAVFLFQRFISPLFGGTQANQPVAGFAITPTSSVVASPIPSLPPTSTVTAAIQHGSGWTVYTVVDTPTSANAVFTDGTNFVPGVCISGNTIDVPNFGDQYSAWVYIENGIEKVQFLPLNPKYQVFQRSTDLGSTQLPPTAVATLSSGSFESIPPGETMGAPPTATLQTEGFLDPNLGVQSEDSSSGIPKWWLYLFAGVALLIVVGGTLLLQR
jgi:hypothetical protein